MNLKDLHNDIRSVTEEGNAGPGHTEIRKHKLLLFPSQQVPVSSFQSVLSHFSGLLIILVISADCIHLVYSSFFLK